MHPVSTIPDRRSQLGLLPRELVALAKRSGTVRALARRLRTEWYVDLGHGCGRTTILAGSPRSGTTWLSNVLNYDNRFRYLFEPLNKAHSEIWRRRPYAVYLPPDLRDDSLERVLRRLLSGRFRDPWSDQYNRKVLGARRLVKTVATNTLLPWIHATFPGTPIILLLRHPCAVAHSQLSLPWARWVESAVYFSCAPLVDEMLHRFVGSARNPSTDFGERILRWCIETYVPLKHFAKGQICPVFYEHLCVRPREEIARIYAFLGQRYSTRVLRWLHMPSQTNWNKRSQEDYASRRTLSAWTREVGREDTERAMELLARFGLDRVYSRDVMPILTSADDAFFGNESI
jgi:hypothetical protein